MCATNHTINSCKGPQVSMSIKYGNCKPLTLPWGFVVAAHYSPRSDTLDVKLILGIIFSLYETLAIIVFKDLFQSLTYMVIFSTDIIILYLDTWNFPLFSFLVCFKFVPTDFYLNLDLQYYLKNSQCSLGGLLNWICNTQKLFICLLPFRYIIIYSFQNAIMKKEQTLLVSACYILFQDVQNRGR